MNSHHAAPSDTVRPGFTIVELIVVISIIGLLVALLLPAVRSSRGAARRMQCSNNMKQLGLALHNYHDTYQRFPTAMGGTGLGATPADGNANRLSGLVALLPYLEQEPLWNQIASPLEFDGVTYPPMGPAPWVAAYEPWQRKIPGFQCPSAERESPDGGQVNYTFCIGDVVQGIHQPKQLRGAFACGLTSRFQDFTDGTSNTIALGEIGTPAGRSVIGQFAIGQPANILTDPSLCLVVLSKPLDKEYPKNVSLGDPGRGGRWADGAAGFSLFQTVLPPNSPSCAVGGAYAVDGVYSAGSGHPGGAQFTLADASVRFIAETIDAGDATRPPPTPEQLADGMMASPYGVWGAIGTLAGAEDVESGW